MSVLSDYINKNLDIGDEYRIVFGKTMPTGKMFCLWHNNIHTPSAKRYGNGIKCFGECQRYYTCYDFLKKFNPKKLEEISQTQVIQEPESHSVRQKIEQFDLDRDKPIAELLKVITHGS